MKLATALSTITVISIVSQTSDASDLLDLKFPSGSSLGGALEYGVDVVRFSLKSLSVIVGNGIGWFVVSILCCLSSLIHFHEFLKSLVFSDALPERDHQ
jgi:hypothetical protein